jgi:hypothetical protein
MRHPSIPPSGAGSRRASFELHRFRRGHWVVETVHDDRALAVAEAKSLLERARGLAAVRVVAVESRDGAFRESVVFYGSSPLVRSLASHRPAPSVGLAQPAGMPLAATPGWPASRVVLLLTLILLTATIGVLNRRNAVAQPWVFDRPEAQRSHAVSMPWER